MKPAKNIQKSARIAGLMYLLIIGTSIIAMIFGPMQLIVEGDYLTTIDNIASDQFLFRAGATYDLLMFISIIILAIALYNVLKPVNKTVALTALLSRIGEALIGTLTVACSMLILFVVNSNSPAQVIHDTVVLLFEFKAALLNIVFAFLGLGSILYCYLFYISRFIPKLLAAFGIFSFALVFIESIYVLIYPVESSVVVGIPAIIFEIIIGVWLITKGVNTGKFKIVPD